MGSCCAKPRDHQHEPDLDRDTLLQALRQLAAYLERKNTNVTAVVVGGCVSTIHLRSRATTHDVDYITSIPPVAARCLEEGIQLVATENPRLSRHWMNSHTDSFIPPEDRLALVQESIAQGVEVFSEGRLTLYAAPWEYAFIAKLARLTSLANSPRVYDMPDAIENLRQYFAREGVTFVPRSEVDRWNARFELELEGAIYERFNQEYSNRFPDSPTPITMND